MEVSQNPQIVSADRLQSGLVIAFSDGTTLYYSAALLHSVAAQAVNLVASEPASEAEEGDHADENIVQTQ